MTSIIFASDLHVNSFTALCPPTQANRTRLQLELWRYWVDFWEWAKTFPRPHIVVLVGDLADLDAKKRTYALLTRDPAEIKKMTIDCLEPVHAVSNRLYFLRGTPAHVGKDGWLEEDIASDIDTAVKTEDGKSSHWFLQRTVDDVRLDILHYASLGKIPKIGAARTAVNVRAQYLEMGEKPPHLVIRAHCHRYATSGDDGYDTLAVHLPAWQAYPDYGYRTGIAKTLSSIGGVVIETKDGQYKLHRKLYDLVTERRVWKLTL